MLKEDRGTMDLGLSLTCAFTQASMREGRRTLSWRADYVTMDLVNCCVKQYACVSSVLVGKEYCKTGGQICDPGCWSTARNSSVPA